MEGASEVGQGINRQVFTEQRGWYGGPPVVWEVDQGEAASKVLGRVLGSEECERGGSWREPASSWVLSWRGAGNPKGSQGCSVSAVGDDREEEGLSGQDRSRGGEEGVGGPSLDPVPEALHASHGVGVMCNEVGLVGGYVEETALPDMMAEKMSDTSAGGG